MKFHTSGSEVDYPITFPQRNNGKGKKSEAINPEPGTRNLLTQTDRIFNLWENFWFIEVYGHFHMMTNEVCMQSGLTPKFA